MTGPGPAKKQKTQYDPDPGPGTSGSRTAENIGPPLGFLGRSQLDQNEFDESTDSDSDEKYFDRDSLLREINADIKNIISNTETGIEEKVRVKKEEEILKKAEAVASNYRGKDGALYTLEIFMRDKNICRSKKDRPGKGDQRAPIIYDKSGVANAIIPANHKLMLLCTRIATNPRHYVKRGNYVLFKFYVDGEALSEGTLHEASISKPDINFAKAYIDTHQVKAEWVMKFFTVIHNRTFDQNHGTGTWNRHQYQLSIILVKDPVSNGSPRIKKLH